MFGIDGQSLEHRGYNDKKVQSGQPFTQDLGVRRYPLAVPVLSVRARWLRKELVRISLSSQY